MQPRALASVAVCLLGFLPMALGATGVHHSVMDTIENNKDARWFVAEKGNPLWAFASGQGNGMCLPTWPFRPDGSKRPAAAMEDWPHVTTCKHLEDKGRDPDWAPDFPTYFVVRKCSPSKVRIAYNLFWEKDGFPSNGHGYDWERVVVDWESFGEYWYKTRLEGSTHGGERHVGPPWSNVPTTVSMQDLWGKGKDLDHPKIFVGWCKHAMFFEKGGTSDVFSCIDSAEKRDDHWMGMSQGDLLIDAGPGSDIGQKIQREDWGKANGTPLNAYNGLC